MGGGSLNSNNASSKRYAIIFGIFALVIVTTAASFAFFTYSRTGQTTTTITSGDIEFSFIEGTNAFLTDAFPVSDTVGANDATGEYTFDVKMSSSSTNNKMTYNVYLLDDNKGTTEDDKYFDNEQIEFALIKNGTYVAGTSSTSGKKLTEVSGFSQGTSEGEGLVLANQEIIANTKDNYKLRIWISDDVNYSNTIDSSGTMIGKFNGYKYSLKVKVTSGVETTTTVSEPVGRVIVANLADENGISAYGVSTSQDSSSVTEWIEVTNETAFKTGNVSNVVRTSTSKVTSKTIQHKVNSYGTYYLHVKNTLGEITTKEVNVKIKEVSRDTSGAATPVIKGNLVPVIMNGSDVIKADTTKGWYNYDQKIWANAVILEENAETYEIGDIIPEEVIESYFVWIPRYEYKIFDEQAGNYTTFTSKGTKKTEIEIQFVTKDDKVQNGDSFGQWLTHPAFTSFDSNGMWVGKFESGYRGATTTGEAQKNENNSSQLIIKPNVYSWRGIQVANAYQTSLGYDTNLASHMMKNTEWGAVAYLSHSKYGAKDDAGNVGTSLRTNNNSGFITGYSATEEPTLGYNSGTSIDGNLNESTELGGDGEYTVNYLNVKSVLSSTTGNYSGIYDMSGGAWEYMMSVVVDTNGNPLSGRHDLLNSGFKGKYACPTCDSTNSGVDSNITVNETGISFPKDNRYFDIYSSSSNYNKYNTRILGDATGEMGPFYQEKDPDESTINKTYWYGDQAYFAYSASPWFMRGGASIYGSNSGIFAFNGNTGTWHGHYGFRVVLVP